jgi:hypothetical protein
MLVLMPKYDVLMVLYPSPDGHLGDILGDPVEGRVLLADQHAPRVVHEPTEVQRADVVDPLHRRVGVGDDIFEPFIVEISVSHLLLLDKNVLLQNAGE